MGWVMHPSDSSAPEPRVTLMEIVILVLSVTVLAVVGAEAIWKLPPEVSRLLQGIDTAICLVFFFDFARRLWRAPSKWGYLKWGWIDLLASIPAVDALRWGRILRLVVILRLVRTLRTAHRIYAAVFARKFQGGMATVLITTFLVLTVSSTAVLLFEVDEKSNIHTAEEALWWSVTTITTVGYGDKFPVTTEGRVVAMILMFMGVGLFGMLSGLVATLFLGNSNAPPPAPPPPPAEVSDLVREVRALRARLDEIAGPPSSAPR